MNLYSVYLVAQIVESCLAIIVFFAIIFLIFKLLSFMKLSRQKLSKIFDKVEAIIESVTNKFPLRNILGRNDND